MATKNFWGERIHFLCDNNHFSEDNLGKKERVPIEFVKQDGASAFYACPKYFEADEQHQYGRFELEPQCFNHLGFNDAKRIVEALEKEYEESLESGIEADLSNYKFSVGQIDIEVLLQDEDNNIYLGIINHKAINR